MEKKRKLGLWLGLVIALLLAGGLLLLWGNRQEQPADQETSAQSGGQDATTVITGPTQQTTLPTEPTETTGTAPTEPAPTEDTTAPTEPAPTETVHSHSYESVTTEPTCTEGGYTTFTCAVCGDVQVKDYSEPAAHDWGSWEVVKEATTDEAGLRKRTCRGCGAEETETVDKLPDGHEHDYDGVTVAPTCTEQGYTEYTCSCGHSYVGSFVDALGHSWSDWTVTKEPTTETKGEQTRTCSHCGDVELEEIDVLENSGAEDEPYIDPRLVIEEMPKYTEYTYKNTSISVYDRRTWGDPPSIWINDDGSLRVVYYNQTGERIETMVEVPPDGYSRVMTIRNDGTLAITLIGCMG